MRTRVNVPANGGGRESEVLTFSALLVLLGRRSRQSIYDLMRRDPSFPRRDSLAASFRSAGCEVKSCSGCIPGRSSS
jgi:predicted DNA-binding transcriptional regulator AlpA